MKNKLTLAKLDNLHVIGAIPKGIDNMDKLDDLIWLSQQLWWGTNNCMNIQYLSKFKNHFDSIKNHFENYYTEENNILKFNYCEMQFNINFVEESEFENISFKIIGVLKFKYLCILIFKNEIDFYFNDYQAKEINDEINTLKQNENSK